MFSWFMMHHWVQSSWNLRLKNHANYTWLHRNYKHCYPYWTWFKKISPHIFSQASSYWLIIVILGLQFKHIVGINLYLKTLSMYRTWRFDFYSLNWTQRLYFFIQEYYMFAFTCRWCKAKGEWVAAAGKPIDYRYRLTLCKFHIQRNTKQRNKALAFNWFYFSVWPAFFFYPNFG
jgi:hypothetical protein